VHTDSVFIFFKYLDIFHILSMCIAMNPPQFFLIIAAIKLKYISDCQVAYKEDERQRVNE